MRDAEQRGCLHQAPAMQDFQKVAKRCMVEAKRLECFRQGSRSLFESCAWQVSGHSLFEGCAWQVSSHPLPALLASAGAAQPRVPQQLETP